MPFSAIVVDQAPDSGRIRRAVRRRPGLVVPSVGRCTGSSRHQLLACDPIESSSSLLPAASAHELTAKETREAELHGGSARSPTSARGPSSARGGRADPTSGPNRSWLSRLASLRSGGRSGLRCGDRSRGRRQRGPRRGPGARRSVGRVRSSRRLAQGGSCSAGRRSSPRARRAHPARQGAHSRWETFYQVNLARRLRFEVKGSSLDLYLAMAKQAPAPFGAYLDLGGTVVCACSPDCS